MFHDGIPLPSTDVQASLIHPVSNGCSSPVEQQQHSPNGEQQASSPLSPEILRELSHYTAPAGNGGNELPSPPDMPAAPAGDGSGASQNNQTGDLTGQFTNDLLSSALQMRGSKRKSTESHGNTQFGGKRASAAGRFPGLSMGSGLNFPSVGLNSSSLLGNLGHMSHPLLMGGSGGSSFLQMPGQTLADIQTMFPSATGNGHLPTSSSSSLSSVFSSATSTIPMSSPPSAATSSSLASGSLPPYLMNPNMAGLLSSGFPLNYSQSMLPESRLFPTPLHSGSGGFSAPSPGSAASSFLSHFNNPTSSLLGAALTQPDRHQMAENGGSSSDDDVIEVTGQ